MNNEINNNEKIVKEHDDVRTLHEVTHYEDHPAREESKAFRHIRDYFHETKAKCFIDNKYCSGGLQIHHAMVEYSAGTEVDWSKLTFKDVDVMENMMPLCRHHHTEKYTGIHTISYPTWILQKYMNEEALDDFERKVKELIESEK
jgi:hypothetical protein